MKRAFVIIMFLFAALFLYADSDAKWQYDNFKKGATETYQNFRAAAMKNYTEFLEKAWKWYNAGPKKEIPKEEPVPPVVYEDEQEKQDDEKIVYEEVVPEPAPTPTPEPSPVVPIEDKQEESGYMSVNVEFYGSPIKIRYPENGQFKLQSTNGDALAKVWNTLAAEEFDATVYDCLDAREKLKLCDYAYLLLVRQFASKVAGTGNESVLLGAYIYAVSGYQMRLATSRSGRLYMLFGSKYQLYDTNYYEIDGSYFYPIDCDESSLQVCSASFEGEYPLSLAIHMEQKFALNSSERRVLRSDIGVTAASVANKNLISFYNDYPTAMIGGDHSTRWALYANAPFSKVTVEALYSSLKSVIQDKDEYIALNILLNFVQTAFEYEYDDKVWGGDRAFFAEETLYYPYADCEDRSILFSRLVRDLLGLDVVMLYYPGHMATAVNIECSGDYLMIGDRKYVVCDPTYINAPVGKTMPDMNNKTAKVITLKR